MLMRLSMRNSSYGTAAVRTCWGSGLNGLPPIEMQPDILYLQEIWLIENVLEHLNQVSDDYMFIERSGVDNKHAILGRPHGGLAVFYRKSCWECPKCSQQYETVRLQNKKLLMRYTGVTNVYMPCHNMRSTFINPDYLETISDIEKSWITTQLIFIYWVGIGTLAWALRSVTTHKQAVLYHS